MNQDTINMRVIFFLMLFPTLILAQTPKIDSILHTIPLKQDTLRSLFEWVANNIEYDIDRANNMTKIGTFIIVDEKEKINTALSNKKGVCEDYALVFNHFCRALGYESYTVEGYTKNLDKIEEDMGHMWNVIKLKDKWYCFDPTWSSGQSFDETWFKVEPKEFLFTHVPYDPIWQLNNYPVIAKTNNLSIPINEYFNFEDSIKLYKNPEHSIFLKNLILRISKYTDRNKNVNYYLRVLEKELDTNKHNKAIAILNNVVGSFNAYIHYKNARFQNPKLKISEIKNLLNSAQNRMMEARILLSDIRIINDVDFKNIFEKIVGLEIQINKELTFIKKYEKSPALFRSFIR